MIKDEICLFQECAVLHFESGFNGQEVDQGKGRTQCVGTEQTPAPAKVLNRG